LVLLGKPGSGKGTQAQRLLSVHQLKNIATGELIRRAIAEQTDLGKSFQHYTSNGLLVPDEVVWSLVEHALDEEPQFPHFLLDGFPRTLPQAELLNKALEKRSWPLSAVIYLEVPDKELICRAVGRRFCSSCGRIYHEEYAPSQRGLHCEQCDGALLWRQDDREEIVRARIVEYQQKTSPLLNFYRECGLLQTIDGVGNPVEIFARIETALARLPQKSILS
jgi:adenylate kinase